MEDWAGNDGDVVRLVVLGLGLGLGGVAITFKF